VRRISILVALAACAPPAAGDDAGDDVAASFSPLGQDVIGALETNHAATRGSTWDLSVDNSFDTDWVIQTPPAQYWGQPVAELPIALPCTGATCDPDFGLLACASQADCTDGGTCTAVHATVNEPGAAMRSLCVGHSDAIYDQIYDTLVAAKSFVDITSLAPPDGRFEAAVRNAISYLSHVAPSLRVRYLFGDVLGGAIVGIGGDTDAVLASLTRDVDPASALRVSVGEYRDGLESWNHVKLIAVDGQTAIVGGHNMWTQHYLQQAPVHDLSMRIHGGAAAQASRFANELWRYTCTPVGGIGGGASISNSPATESACDDLFELAVSPSSGSAKVVSIGRLGAIGDEASDDAIVALVDAAHTQLRLSLQDIGPYGDAAAWPETYLRALDSALARGVDVELVLSNLDATPGGLSADSASYSNGWTPADVVQRLSAYATAHPEIATPGGNMATLLCQRFHAVTLRPSADDTWPDGTGFANHAKLVIADDAAFYLGSQNWYPANLSEYGYIVDDVDATHALLDAYYSKVWAASQRGAACTL
jgi:phosphatidylserine/phosphatidylglycerophosphate/cardiolipin synthase-like enzyme